MEKERVVEIFMGLILIILLVIMINSFLPSNKSTSNVIISNSFNQVTYNNQQAREYDSDYYNHYNSYYEDDIDYSGFSRKTTRNGLFGNTIDEYNVYVTNHEREGYYITVYFYFEDYSGKERSYPIRKYVSAKDQVKFTYTDVSSDREKHYRWWYEIKVN